MQTARSEQASVRTLEAAGEEVPVSVAAAWPQTAVGQAAAACDDSTAALSPGMNGRLPEEAILGSQIR